MKSDNGPCTDVTLFRFFSFKQKKPHHSIYHVEFLENLLPANSYGTPNLPINWGEKRCVTTLITAAEETRITLVAHIFPVSLGSHIFMSLHQAVLKLRTFNKFGKKN